jgi:cytochrome bd-type quinol oxidase subunit 2
MKLGSDWLVFALLAALAAVFAWRGTAEDLIFAGGVAAGLVLALCATGRLGSGVQRWISARWDRAAAALESLVKAVLVVGAVGVVLGTVGFGCFWLWDRYDTSQREKCAAIARYRSNASVDELRWHDENCPRR